MKRLTHRRSDLLGQVPVYHLYGEQAAGAEPEFLHCESIALRSRIYQWTIQPHRHEDLFQVLFATRGGASIVQDDHRQQCDGPFGVVIPARSVHGFCFGCDIDGWVMTIATAHLAPLLSAAPLIATRLADPAVLRFGKRTLGLERLFLHLEQEIAGSCIARLGALQSLVALILIEFGRCVDVGTTAAAGPHGRDLPRVWRYQALIEREFRRHRPVEDYARILAVTPVQLNRSCRAVLGRSALAVIHDRLLLEAKRYLIYSSMTVAEIAYVLGFDDPSYFARFFARLAGHAPSVYRRSAKGGGAWLPRLER